ncbi:hypothetical protein ACFPIJ_61945 [Dactylosporangium cerinum]|uniref:Uncharacterized protein n=1 Tax=Dactylosporangium cerinum TaxID=1434730 RepID=A0ABV9WLK0_9ACTN
MVAPTESEAIPEWPARSAQLGILDAERDAILRGGGSGPASKYLRAASPLPSRHRERISAREVAGGRSVQY